MSHYCDILSKILYWFIDMFFILNFVGQNSQRCLLTQVWLYSQRNLNTKLWIFLTCFCQLFIRHLKYIISSNNSYPRSLANQGHAAIMSNSSLTNGFRHQTWSSFVEDSIFTIETEFIHCHMKPEVCWF